ncbi:MAG TPA: PorV/PorQ family protein, partial [Spirochaetota bacterium]|nr:PorV/PorQ family protein [Spirochaetota bacterium]
MKKTIKTFILLLTVTGFLTAQSGLTADGAISVLPSARGLAIGEAYGSLGNDLQSMYFNPAGLALIKWPEASISYFQFIEGVIYFNGAYAYPLGKAGCLAGDFGFMSAGEFTEKDNYQDIGKIKGTDLIAQLGYALSPLKNLFVGASMRWYAQNHKEMGMSVNFNLGALYAFRFLSIAEYQRRNFGIGVSVQNLGTPVKSGSTKAKMPLNIKGGIYYMPRSVLAVAFDLNYMLENGMHYNLGLEIMPEWYISPRLGYKFGLKGNESFTCGLGVNVRKKPIKIRADYAILPMFDFGMQHYITLTFNYKVKKTMEEFQDEKMAAAYAEKREEERRAKLEKERQAMKSGTSLAIAELEPRNVEKMDALMV